MSKKQVTATAQGKDLAAFRAAHDKNFIVPKKINDALAKMAEEGTDRWEYEMDFLKKACLSTTDLAMFREQFEGHIVNVGGDRSPKRVWVATKAAAEKMRGMV